MMRLLVEGARGAVWYVEKTNVMWWLANDKPRPLALEAHEARNILRRC